MVAQSGQKVFGAGRFYGIPNVTTPTPTQLLGLTQNWALDFKRDIKRLYGENQLPADVASGMLQVTGKVTAGVLVGRMLNDLMLNGTMSTGQISWVNKESGISSTAGAGGALITVALSSLWTTDLGVIASSDGVPMTRIASTVPTANQYYVAAGVYTLSSGGITAKISYLYSPVAGGQTLNMSNQPMGKIGNFTAVLETLWGTEKSVVTLNNCMASDWGMQTVLDDYTKPTFGFEAAADANDTLGTFAYAELS